MLQGTCVNTISEKGHILGYVIKTKRRTVNLSPAYIQSGIKAGTINISNISIDVNGKLIYFKDTDISGYISIGRETVLQIMSQFKGNEVSLKFKIDPEPNRIVDKYNELKSSGRAYFSVNRLNRHLYIVREACMDVVGIEGLPIEKIQEICNDLASKNLAVYTITGKNIYYLSGEYSVHTIADNPMVLIDETETGLFNGLSVNTIDFRGINFAHSRISKKSFCNAKINKVLHFNVLQEETNEA